MWSLAVSNTSGAQKQTSQVLTTMCKMLSATLKSFLGDLRWVARFGLMSQIRASQIEAPIGSVFQKYVSSTFMVKMRINLGS